MTPIELLKHKYLLNGLKQSKEEIWELLHRYATSHFDGTWSRRLVYKSNIEEDVSNRGIIYTAFKFADMYHLGKQIHTIGKTLPKVEGQFDFEFDWEFCKGAFAIIKPFIEQPFIAHWSKLEWEQHKIENRNLQIRIYADFYRKMNTPAIINSTNQ